MLWGLIEIAANLFQGYLLMFFMRSKLHLTQRHRLADVFCILLTTIFCSLQPHLFPMIPDILVFLIPLGYALIVSDDHLSVCCFWTSILTLLFLTTVNLLIDIVMEYCGNSFNELTEPGYGRVAYLLFTNSILWFLIYSAAKIKIENSEIHAPILLVYLLLNVCIFTVEEFLFRTQLEIETLLKGEDGSFFWIYLALLVCTYLVILLFRFMSLSVSREAQYRTELSHNELIKKNQQEIENLYCNAMEKMHDLKHHYQVLENMFIADLNQEAFAYIQESKQYITSDEIFLTGCIAVDALLTSKCLRIKKENISFKFVGCPLEDLPITSSDFCAILGNLLDNAIEGATQSAAQYTPSIKLTLSKSWGMLYVFCQNTCDPQSIRITAEKNFFSRKKSFTEHGLGIPSIRRTVSRYDGRCEFIIEGTTFCAKVVIPYPFSQA